MSNQISKTCLIMDKVFLSDCEITKNSSKSQIFLRLFLSIPNIFCIFVLINANIANNIR